MSVVEIKVPDIGDYKDVDVIEVMVKAGDVVAVDQSLITLETDKATMDVPADVVGRIVEVKIKVGDKASQGTVIATVEAGAAAAAPRPRKPRFRRPHPLPLRPPRRPRRRPRSTAAAPISNATCSSWAPARAATRPLSAAPTSA